MNIDLRLELPEDYRESLILYRNLIMSPFRRAFPDYEDAIYDIDPEKSVEFDRSFPQKERMEGTSTQKRFAEVLAMQKDYDSINNK